MLPVSGQSRTGSGHSSIVSDPARRVIIVTAVDVVVVNKIGRRRRGRRGCRREGWRRGGPRPGSLGLVLTFPVACRGAGGSRRGGGRRRRRLDVDVGARRGPRFGSDLGPSRRAGVLGTGRVGVVPRCRQGVLARGQTAHGGSARTHGTDAPTCVRALVASSASPSPCPGAVRTSGTEAAAVLFSFQP